MDNYRSLLDDNSRAVSLMMPVAYTCYKVCNLHDSRSRDTAVTDIDKQCLGSRLLTVDSCVSAVMRHHKTFQKEFDRTFINNNPFLGLGKKDNLEFATPDKDEINENE